MPESQEGGFQVFYSKGVHQMPYMLGVANKIKKSRIVSGLRRVSKKGGKKRQFKVSLNKVPVIRKVREKDFSLYYLGIALAVFIVLAVCLVPEFGVGGIILPAVLVPTFFFIIAALKSLVKRD